jgi:hypothetical protein
MPVDPGADPGVDATDRTGAPLAAGAGP